MPMIKIITIDEKSLYLTNVIKLADANSKTLGFLPKRAFYDSATKKQILVALDDKDIFCGYLLYAISKKEASIVHLCVKSSQRHQGVAKKLFEALTKITRNSFRIRVHCRRDYEENKIWPKLGFYAIGEKPAKTMGSILTIWWFEHEHPTIFAQNPAKFQAVIDANIFNDLQCTPQSACEKESHSLLADYLNVELCLTSEIYNEIDRREDETERQRGKKFAHSFVILRSSDDEFHKNCERLRHFFPKKMSRRDESYLRQLARTIAANAPFFVTRDQTVLNWSEKIYEQFRIRIISPSNLIIHQNELLRETEYQPIQLAGQIEIKRVDLRQISSLEDTFYASQKQESKATFKEKLQSCLAEQELFETQIVQNSTGQTLALLVYKRQKQHELEMPLFRLVQNTLSATLSRYLIFNTILQSTHEKRILTQVTDSCLSDEVVDALQENAFISKNNFWVKANLPFVGTTKELVPRLIELSDDLPYANQYFKLFTDILKADHIPRRLEVERSLWPAKITDLDIPNFVVSIRPQYAMHLFDSNLAKQDIFGGEKSLIWNVENVYYRASHPQVLSAPARVLWYVSQGDGNYQGTMSIRACSYIDEIVIDKPKSLYNQFKRLGVYEWKEVFEAAHQNLDQDMMAFRFSHTEIFNKPIFRELLNTIWKEEKGKEFNILAPIPISNQLFFRLYQMGV
jgi:predicted GNAT family acetyltransferase/predicted nucleic acid-binding protein